jgi:hypothetical protein
MPPCLYLGYNNDQGQLVWAKASRRVSTQSSPAIQPNRACFRNSLHVVADHQRTATCTYTLAGLAATLWLAVSKLFMDRPQVWRAMVQGSLHGSGPANTHRGALSGRSGMWGEPVGSCCSRNGPSSVGAPAARASMLHGVRRCLACSLLCVDVARRTHYVALWPSDCVRCRRTRACALDTWFICVFYVSTDRPAGSRRQ